MSVDFELELVWIPVSDVDLEKMFYLEQACFDLLVDIPNGLPGHRIVQVTRLGQCARSGSARGSPPPSPARSGGCSWSLAFLLPATNWPPGASRSARCATLSTAHGCPDRTRAGRTICRSPSSATPTATGGCYKNVAASPVHPIADRTPPSQAIELT
jgi:hypothetical protein